MVNALTFSWSNYLFSMLRSSDLNEERKRHDQAVEQLQAAQAKWSRKRTERLVGWLVVLGLTALLDSISVYIGPSPKEREKEEIKDR